MCPLSGVGQVACSRWDELTDFEKMCVRRCLRPDKVLPMVAEFVKKHLGAQYIEPPPFSLEECYADSSALSPLVFILSPGQDPMAQLLKFAEQKGMAKNVKAISLGQGQGPIAQRLINDALQTGGWVVRLDLTRGVARQSVHCKSPCRRRNQWRGRRKRGVL